MPGTIAALGVMLLLLPGFLASYVVQCLCSRRKQNDLEKIVEALILSLVCYVISALMIGTALPFNWQAQTASSGSINYRVSDFQPWKLSILVLVPIALGVTIAVIINNDLLRFLRKIRLGRYYVTDRTTRSSIWNDVFTDNKTVGFAQVELSDGRSVLGWVKYYSDDGDEGSLFLQRAAWVDTATSKAEEIPGAGILITKTAGVRTVMFLQSDEQLSIEK